MVMMMMMMVMVMVMMMMVVVMVIMMATMHRIVRWNIVTTMVNDGDDDNRL